MSPYTFLNINNYFKLAVEHTPALHRRPRPPPGSWGRRWFSAWHIKGHHWRIPLSDTLTLVLQKGT